MQQPTPTPISFHSLITTQGSGVSTAITTATLPAGEKVCGSAWCVRALPLFASRAKIMGQIARPSGTQKPRWRLKQRSDDLCILSPVTYIYIISILCFVTLSTQELIIISANMHGSLATCNSYMHIPVGSCN